MGFDLGNTQSAIIPVMTGNPNLNAEACHLLMQAGVYANQIGYPAVPKKRARIRMSIMATHSREHMDKVLNGWEWVDNKLNITNKNQAHNGNTKKEVQGAEHGRNQAETAGSSIPDHAGSGARGPESDEDHAQDGQK